MTLLKMLSYSWAAFVLSIGFATPALAKWPTTEFIFENRDPRSNATLSSLNPFGGYSDEQQAVATRYKKYLTKVAKYYESMGFKGPLLPLVDGRKGGKATAKKS